MTRRGFIVPDAECHDPAIEAHTPHDIPSTYEQSLKSAYVYVAPGFEVLQAVIIASPELPRPQILSMGRPHFSCLPVDFLHILSPSSDKRDGQTPRPFYFLAPNLTSVQLRQLRTYQDPLFLPCDLTCLVYIAQARF